MHNCTTNSDTEFNPISRCCGIEAEDDQPLTTCGKCGKFTVWECADCGAVEWVPKEIAGIKKVFPLRWSRPQDWR